VSMLIVIALIHSECVSHKSQHQGLTVPHCAQELHSQRDRKVQVQSQFRDELYRLGTRYKNLSWGHRAMQTACVNTLLLPAACWLLSGRAATHLQVVLDGCSTQQQPVAAPKRQQHTPAAAA
jgi:hypothetical protein